MWLFIQDLKHSTCSQVSEETPSDSETTSKLSPTVRKTSTLSLSSYHECMQEKLNQLPSGMTFQPSLPACLIPESMSLSEASHVKTFRLLGMAKALWKETEADFFSRSCASPANLDPDLYFSKTLLQSETTGWTPWLKNLPKSGMTCDGVLCPLPQWEPITNENDGFYWLTPKASGIEEDYDTYIARMRANPDPKCNTKTRPGNLYQQVSNPEFWPTKRGLVAPTGEIRMVPTPNTMDYMDTRSDEAMKRSYEEIRKGRTAPCNLREWIHEEMWPTPNNRDYKGVRRNLVDGENTSGKGVAYGKDLTQAVLEKQMWPTPRASNPGSRPNGKGGKILEEEVQIAAGSRVRGEKLEMWPTPTNSNYKDCGPVGSKSWQHQLDRGHLDAHVKEPDNNGQLNPDWVEWLMGFPIHWTKANGNIYTQLSEKEQKRIVKPIVGSDYILASSWWDEEPAIPRITAKKVQRVERIKRLGNAVVPFQARCAFEYLLGIIRVKPKQEMTQLFKAEVTFNTEPVKKREVIQETKQKVELKMPTLFGSK